MTVVSALVDLAMAVVVGVIVSALAYAWGNAVWTRAKSHITPEGAKVYTVQWPLFFGSAERFSELLNPWTDPAAVIVDFAESRVADESAQTARYEAAGNQIRLRHLSPDCQRLLKRAGQLMIDSDDDPDYQIAANYGVRTGQMGLAH